MGKNGPCCHCGVPSTPLWRNGPPDKPVLCNACGSRWRTKGSLTNYTPLHSRAELDNFSNHKAARIKIVNNRDKESNFLKRKRAYENVVIGNIASNYSDGLWKVFEDDTSNRSSSGSAGSNFEKFDATYVNEFSGFSQAFAIEADRMSPAKKRASIPQPKSFSIAGLTKDLCAILHQQQSSGFYVPEEDNLLLESDKSVITCETGYGSYLIRDTSSAMREEDSEAISFSVDNKPHLGNEAFGRVSNYLGTQLEEVERNNKLCEILETYGSQSLQLTENTNQKDVLGNHEDFGRHSSNEDDSRQPNSFQSLSASSDFVDSTSTLSGGFNASLSDKSND